MPSIGFKKKKKKKREGGVGGNSIVESRWVELKNVCEEFHRLSRLEFSEGNLCNWFEFFLKKNLFRFRK